MLLEIKNRREISCAAPLIINEKSAIQYSAKKNPTIASLLIGRFKILFIFPFLKNYYLKHINFDKDYLNQEIESSYLSGCFLIVKASIFSHINGFSNKIFLHLKMQI